MYYRIASNRYHQGRRAFREHRDSAKRRGIEFLFTFEEWRKWWEDHLGPDWQKKRGRRKGQYVMARFEDKGPYAIWNVKCILHEDNLREARLREKGGVALTEDQVKEVYLAVKSIPYLAKHYGVGCGLIRNIKLGLRYKELTKDLGPAPRVWINKSKYTPEDAIFEPKPT
jgi:hypothetical protein